MNRYPVIMPAGDCAVVVEFANEMMKEILSWKVMPQVVRMLPSVLHNQCCLLVQADPDTAFPRIVT